MAFSKLVNKKQLKLAQARLSRRASLLRRNDQAIDKAGPNIKALLEVAPIKPNDCKEFVRQLVDKDAARLYKAGIKTDRQHKLYRVAIMQGICIGLEAGKK